MFDEIFIKIPIKQHAMYRKWAVLEKIWNKKKIPYLPTLPVIVLAMFGPQHHNATTTWNIKYFWLDIRHNSLSITNMLLRTRV